MCIILLCSHNYPTSTLNSIGGFYLMLVEDKLKTKLNAIYSKSDLAMIQDVLNMLSWIYDDYVNETLRKLLNC